MRYLLLLLCIVMAASASAQVQYLGSPTTTVRNRGNFVSDSLFYLPKRQKAPSDTGAVRYAIADSSVYVWTGYQWNKIAPGAFVAIADTASMLNPYTRGSGTVNYLPKFTGTRTFGNSILYSTTNSVGIGTDTIYSDNSIFPRLAVTRISDNKKSVGIGYTGDYGYVWAVNSGITWKTLALNPFGGSVAIGDTSAASKLSILESKSTSLSTAANFLTLGLSVDDNTAYNNIGVGGGIAFRGKRNTSGTLTVYGAIDAGKESILNDEYGGSLRFYTNQNSTGVPLERMRITSAGELLIGTTTDAGAYALQVAGAGYFTGLVTASNGTLLGGSGSTSRIPRFNSTNSFENSPLWSDNNTVESWKPFTLNPDLSTDIYILFKNKTTSIGVIGSDTAIAAAGDKSAMSYYVYGNNNMHFYTNNTKKMTLTGPGELLIGTTLDAGAYALQVAGSIYNTGGAVFAASSGGVGIGTTTSAKFEVAGEAKFLGVGINVSPTSVGTIRNYIRMLSSGTDFYIGSESNTANNFFSGAAAYDAVLFSSTPLNFITNAASRMYINTLGNVGIGTMSPSQKLHVNGKAKFTTAAGGVVVGTPTDSTRSFSAGGNTFEIQTYLEQASDTDPPDVFFVRARNTITSKANIDTLDRLGSVTFLGWLNSAARTSAEFYSEVTSIDSANNNVESDVIIKQRSGASENVNFTLNSNGNLTIRSAFTTGAPTSGTAKPWRLGEAATVSPTSPNRTIRVEIDGTVYYIHAKTTND